MKCTFLSNVWVNWATIFRFLPLGTEATEKRRRWSDNSVTCACCCRQWRPKFPVTDGGLFEIKLDALLRFGDGFVKVFTTTKISLAVKFRWHKFIVNFILGDFVLSGTYLWFGPLVVSTSARFCLLAVRSVVLLLIWPLYKSDMLPKVQAWMSEEEMLFRFHFELFNDCPRASARLRSWSRSPRTSHSSLALKKIFSMLVFILYNLLLRSSNICLTKEHWINIFQILMINLFGQNKLMKMHSSFFLE